MSLKRVIVLSEHFAPSTAATAQLAVDMSNELTKRGHQIVVLTGTAAKQHNLQSPKNLQVVRLNNNQKHANSIVAKALRGLGFMSSSLSWCLLNTKRTDQLIIFSNPPYAGSLGTIIKILKNVDYIFIFQDLFPRSAVISGVLPAAGPITGLWRLLMSAICAQARCTITLSQAMKERLKKELFFKSKIEVIHNWAVERGEQGEWKGNNFATKNNLGSKLTVQYSGNFGRMHDLMTLLETSRVLHQSPIEFCFIGDGPKKEQIINYKECFNLQNVRIFPYQPRNSLPLSLAACDLSVVGLMPGAEDTVAPCKFYGIIASSKAIILIAQEDCDLARFVLHHQIGIVVEPGESEFLATELLKLNDDRLRLANMQMNAYRVYKEHFGLEKSIDLYEAILD